MIQTVRKAWAIPELRKKIIFTLLILLIFRIGNAIAVPYVNTEALGTYLSSAGTSYLTLLKLRGRDWRQAACLSVGGIQRTGDGKPAKLPPALEMYLQNHPNTQKVILCLDRDVPGIEAARAIAAVLKDYQVVENFPPQGKDFNDFLLSQRGIPRRARTRGGDAR